MNNYYKYIKNQKEKFLSFESDNKHWASGQKRFLDIFFFDINRDSKILDIACGDGVGLKEFKNMGFKNITGVEFNQKKIENAKLFGYPIYKLDMHNLSNLKKIKFDIIYSSHTLEHSMYPEKVLSELSNHLKDKGYLVVVLPYPDIKHDSKDAHIARKNIGSNVYDDGKKIISFFQKNDFRCIDKFYDTFREPEIWLVFKKKINNTNTNYINISQKINLNNFVKPFFLNYLYLEQYTFISLLKLNIKKMMNIFQRQ